MQSLYSQLRHGYHITTHIIYAVVHVLIVNIDSAEIIWAVMWYPCLNCEYRLCIDYMGSYVVSMS